MPISVTIPALDKPDTVKDAVISVLAKEWPLSAKQVYNQVKRMRMEVSYQAVHKTLLGMVDSGVLERTGRDYMISGEWIEETGRFVSSLKDRYSKGGKNAIDNESQFVFHTIYDVDRFMLEMKGRMIDKTTREKPLVCLHWSHYWIPIFLEKQVYRKMKDMIKYSRYYCAVSGDTPVDRWCSIPSAGWMIRGFPIIWFWET